MKILELTRSFHPSIGGMEKFVSDKLKIYHALEHDYQVITTTHSEKKLNNSEKLDTVKYLTSYTPYEISPNLNQAMNLEYDLLSVNQVGYYYSDYAIQKAFSEGKKIVLTPHLYFHTNKYKYIKDFHSKWILPGLFKKVNRIICFTEYEAHYWTDKFPFVKSKIEIIPHYFKPSIIQADICPNEYGNYFLFLGRAAKNKRIDLLIPSFDKIDTDYQLILTIGKDEIPSSINNIVENNKRIHLLGSVSEEKKQNLLANCSSLILPTDYEAFGIVNFEASYYKKPILLSNLKIFKSILDGKGVVYFENNTKALENAIRNFISMDEKEKSELGINNFSNLSKYSFELAAKKYGYLFEKLF